MYKNSVDSSGDSEEIQLRTDIGKTGTGKGRVMVSSSPFADENEVERQGRERGRESRWGGIQVHKTVEISRGDRDEHGDGDAESISSVESGSAPNTPWPREGMGRSDKDMV